MTIPQEVHDALTRAGGKNWKGQPLYKFAWSGNETYLISTGLTYEPMRIVSQDCWILMKWEGPEFWGSKEEWERNNWEVGGLLTAGPYPSEGRYRVLSKLLKHVVKDDVLSFEVIIPDRKFVEEVLPGIKAFQELTTEQKAKHIADREKSEKEELAKKFAKSRENYRGAASTKQVKDRVESLERYMGDKAWQQRVLNQTNSDRSNDGTDTAV